MWTNGQRYMYMNVETHMVVQELYFSGHIIHIHGSSSIHTPTHKISAKRQGKKIQELSCTAASIGSDIDVQVG